MKSASLYMEFGNIVRKNRYRLKLTQDALAERVGLSRTSITNIESGRQKILLHQFFELAGALSISPQALLPTMQPKTQIELIEQALPQDLSRKDKDLILRTVNELGTSKSK